MRWLGLLALAVLAIVALWERLKEWWEKARRVEGAWRGAAKHLGGRFTGNPFSIRPAISFQDRGVDMVLGQYTRRREEFAIGRGVCFVARCHGLISPRLRLRIRSRFVDDQLLTFRRSDVVTDLTQFRTLADIPEESAPTLAFLGRKNREFLLEGLALRRYDRLEVENETVVCELLEGIATQQEIVEHFRWMKDLVARLRDPGPEVPSRLAASATSDPIAEERRANLIALQREFPATELAGKASRAALEDPAPEVRLAGAVGLGPEGFETLSELAAANRGIGIETRVEALRHLVQRAPRDAVVPLLDGILHDAPWELRHEAIAAAGALRHTGAVPLLLDQLDTSDLQVTAVAARALGEIGDPRAEPALVEVLRSGDAAAAIAAAQALGRMGSVAAVQPLLDRTAGLLTSARLRSAATEAIAAIQRRLTGADNGQLALSDAGDSRGTLTIAGEPTSGEVSLAEHAKPAAKRAELSISDIEP